MVRPKGCQRTWQSLGDFLESTFALRVTAHQCTDPRAIAKIHGCVDSGDDLIVTEDDYNKLYNDPYFTQVMNKIHQEQSKSSTQKHYYVFSDETDKDCLDRFRKQYGVEVISYPEGKHEYQNYYIQKLVNSYRDKLSKKPLT